MPEIHGTKETKEVLVAMKGAALLCYKAQKAGRKPDGTIDYQAAGTAFATLLMTSPQIVADFKAAAENIGEVVQEVKDLSIFEALDVVATAGICAKEAAEEIAK